MASRVLSLRMDEDLWARIRAHAARRGMSAQDYVVRTLVRDDFDERFNAAVQETERFYGSPAGPAALGAPPVHHPDPAPAPPAAQSRPSAGIR